MHVIQQINVNAKNKTQSCVRSKMGDFEDLLLQTNANLQGNIMVCCHAAHVVLSHMQKSTKARKFCFLEDFGILEDS